MEKKIRVIKVEPNEKPYVGYIKNTPLAVNRYYRINGSCCSFDYGDNGLVIYYH